MVTGRELPVLSIVIPTFNEMKFGFLPKIFKQLLKHPQANKIEIICVDSNSNDGTIDFINRYQNVVFKKHNKNLVDHAFITD